MFWQFNIESISFFTYLIAFVVGIFVCATPCVYPIMPVIVSYIGGGEVRTKKEGFFKSLAYVFGLASVYSSLGAIAALSGGLFGVIQNKFLVNFSVGSVFTIMGLFMLDVFHLPQITFFKTSSFKEKSGIGGGFLLGAVSGLVIGPCTTPVLGAILAFVAAKKNLLAGMSLLFTYALGMGTPLLLLGTFVGFLKKLPKAGYWMVRVKKIFGLLLIACGIYFLIGIKFE